MSTAAPRGRGRARRRGRFGAPFRAGARASVRPGPPLRAAPAPRPVPRPQLAGEHHRGRQGLGGAPDVPEGTASAATTRRRHRERHTPSPQSSSSIATASGASCDREGLRRSPHPHPALCRPSHKTTHGHRLPCAQLGPASQSPTAFPMTNRVRETKAPLTGEHPAARRARRRQSLRVKQRRTAISASC